MERPKQRPSGRRGHATRVMLGSRTAPFHAVFGLEWRAQPRSSVVTPLPVEIVVGGRESGGATVAEEGGSV